MATVLIRGKEVYLADDIVEAGDDMIRKALAASWPDAATMEFSVVGREQAATVSDRAPAVITSRSAATTKH